MTTLNDLKERNFIVTPVPNSVTHRNLYNGFVKGDHHGIDIKPYGKGKGSPLFSPVNGVVTYKGYNENGKGYYMIIRMNGMVDNKYVYVSVGHMLNDAFYKAIKKGDSLSQACRIGSLGSSGIATNYLAYFQVALSKTAVSKNISNSICVDPCKYTHLRKGQKQSSASKFKILKYGKEV